MTALQRQDLLTDITETELAALADEELAAGQPDPVAAAIAGALAEIQSCLDPEALDADTLFALWRPLAIERLYARRGQVPDKRRQAADRARELAAQLAKETAWGAQSPISIRSSS